jgi:ribose transport system ATP-binding protein
VSNAQQIEDIRVLHEGSHPEVSARLSLRHATKTYGVATVLRDVSLDLAAGEVHGLVGQNGSGKSTLVKILSGILRPDTGAALTVDGAPLHLPTRPQQLNELGVSFVHQDLGLLSDATVVENIRMGRLRRHPLTRRILWNGEIERAAATLARLRAPIDPRARIEDLKPNQRALVAIARALQTHGQGGGCVVFDESTQSMPRESLGEFYDVVDQLADEGTAVLIVSHRLDEVLRLAHRVTVLQDGRAVAEGVSTTDMDEASLGRLLLGREVELDHITKRTSTTSPHDGVNAVRGLTSQELRGLDLDVYRGEVLGVTGVTGAGHEELAAILGGASAATAGTLTTARNVAVDLTVHDVRSRIQAHIGFVPEQRAAEGLAVDMTAVENLTLPRINSPENRLHLRRRWQEAEFDEAVDLLGITPRSPDLPVTSFSGGNQQKILLAKWLLNRPDVLVLHEPTQAVDVGARIDILRAVRRAAEDGAAVIISSVEAQDLAYVCDRVLVLRDGAVRTELSGDMTAHQILDEL